MGRLWGGHGYRCPASFSRWRGTCTLWWQACQAVAHVADAGYLIVEPHEVAVVYMLPKIHDPVASWDDLLHILASPDLPRPVRLRWLNADGTCRRDAWAPR